MTRATAASPVSSPGDVEVDVRAAVEAKDARAALAELERLYGVAIYRYLRAMIDDDDAAHDVWQTTFLQAFRDLDRFSGRSSLKTWLYRIARHRCLDELRARRRRQKRFTLTAVAPEAEDVGASPEDRLGDRERLSALERCVRALAPEARAAVLLRYAQGFSYQEMSEVCGEKPATLRARVSRAMPVLRKCVEGEGA